jgi:DNA-binding response OmpR family regulator
MSAAKILIIEDDESINLLIRENLRGESYEVFSAWDGVAGLQAAREKTPDLIILDILLPRMNGWEVYQQIRRENDPLRRVPVIVVSVLAKESKIPKDDPGPLALIPKPFDVRDLVNEVGRIINDRK